MATFLQAFWIGLSLIIAIGSQNAFILKQGIKKQHVFWVCFICAMSDSILIYIGISSFSIAVDRYPLLLIYAKYLGAAFLFFYVAFSLYAAFTTDETMPLHTAESNSLLKTIMLCLAFTWLNPHVYLDTVVLVGSIAVQFHDEIEIFTLGILSASWLFFFTLGYGAKYLTPIFQQPMAWKALNTMIAFVMWVIAIKLII